MYKIENGKSPEKTTWTFLMYFLAVFVYMAVELLTVFQIETEF